jgi:hypothetical protein
VEEGFGFRFRFSLSCTCSDISLGFLVVRARRVVGEHGGDGSGTRCAVCVGRCRA